MKKKEFKNLGRYYIVKISLLLVLFTLFTTEIYGVIPTKPIKVAPLPVMRVTSIKKDNLSGDIEISKEYRDVIIKKEDLQEEFFFPKIDMEIEKNQAMGSVAPPPEDPSFVSQFMVKLGKANLSKKVEKAKEICDKAIAIGTFIDKLTGGDLIAMPVVKKQTFGETDIYIVFQSAKIYPQYAEIEVYIKIDMKKKDFNGKNSVLYFGAKSIKFSQDKGIIQGVVGLIEDYAIKLGEDNDKAGLYIKKMEQIEGSGTESTDDDKYTGTYVLFDCDGFKEMGFGGAVFFSRAWIIPTDNFGVPRKADASKDLSNTARVHAHFQMIAQDFNDIFINIDIDHFVMAKWDKMSFYLGEANLDLSSSRNPVGIPYNHVNTMGNTWEGVYIKSVGITLPKPFKRSSSSFGSNSSQTSRIKIGAEHLLIDEFGVFGDFHVSGQAPLIGGPIMDGKWGWSLDSIGIRIEADSITSFGFRGGLGVPILSKKGPLKYTCSWRLVDGKDQYKFTARKKCKKHFPMWNAASVDITGIKLDIGYTGDEFKPSVGFWGSLAIGNPKDYAKSQKGSMVKMPELIFKDLRFSTSAPITYESLEIKKGGGKVVSFPVMVSHPKLTNLANGDTKLSFDLIINLMKEGGGVSATGSFGLIGEEKKNGNGGLELVYKDFNFEGATVEVSLPQFYGKGQLCMFDKDPVYGKGFSANLLVKIIGKDLKTKDGKFNLYMNAIFGSTSGYRYWLVDGFMESELLQVPIVPPDVLTLNGFGGGAFHHMRPSGYDLSLAKGGGTATCGSDAKGYCGIIYKPTLETKLGIKFSTSFSAKAGLVDGLLTCILRFGNNYSLQNITFWGTADIIVPTDEVQKVLKKVEDAVPNNLMNAQALKDDRQKVFDGKSGIKAAVGISLDFEDSFVFHAFADVQLNLADVIKGNGTLDILVDPGGEGEDLVWHFYLGGYSDGSVEAKAFFSDEPIPLYPVAATIDYGGFEVEAKAYFLTGNDIPGPPPAPAEVVAFFGEEANSDNRGKLDECPGSSTADGTGIAFGAGAFIHFNKIKKGWLNSCVKGYSVGVGGGIGFDLALLKYSKDDYCSDGSTPIGGINGARATGRVYAFIGVEEGNVSCIPLPRLGVGAILDFDVNKPSYIEGKIVVHFIKRFKLKFKTGEKCGKGCSG